MRKVVDKGCELTSRKRIPTNISDVTGSNALRLKINTQKSKAVDFGNIDLTKTHKFEEIVSPVIEEPIDQPKTIKVLKKTIPREQTLETLKKSKLVQTGRRLFEANFVEEKLLKKTQRINVRRSAEETLKTPVKKTPMKKTQRRKMTNAMEKTTPRSLKK